MTKTTIITGASSGIGEELAKLLASEYDHLVLCGRNEENLKKLSQSLPCKTTIIIADLTETVERKKIISFIQNNAVHLVINNAGFGFYGASFDLSTQDQINILNVNAVALSEITIEGIKAMIVNNIQGIILNVSSAASFLPFPYFAMYAASKTFAKNFSKSLDEETKPLGIRVLTSCPGMVITDFGRRAAKGIRKKSHSIFSMPVQKVAKVIKKQIETKKSVLLFDWQYKIAIFLAKFIPQKWLTQILKKILPTI